MRAYRFRIHLTGRFPLYVAFGGTWMEACRFLCHGEGAGKVDITDIFEGREDRGAAALPFDGPRGRAYLAYFSHPKDKHTPYAAIAHEVTHIAQSHFALLCLPSGFTENADGDRETLAYFIGDLCSQLHVGLEEWRKRQARSRARKRSGGSPPHARPVGRRR